MKKKESTFNVEASTIVVSPTITTDHYQQIDNTVVDLRGSIKRDWFVNHAYFCLPLTIANQYGFGIRSLHTFEATWNGGQSPADVTVRILDGDSNGFQQISSHFGMGTVTIQNHMVWHAPERINLFTLDPPNMFKDGITNMNGVIEADNLKRDFTFNLKLTRVNHTITIKKGELISAVLPIQRYVADAFTLRKGTEIFGDSYDTYIQEQSNAYAEERRTVDRTKRHGIGRRYFKGEDPSGSPYKDHQNKIKPN
jgi:hypothetical protein